MAWPSVRRFMTIIVLLAACAHTRQPTRPKLTVSAGDTSIEIDVINCARHVAESPVFMFDSVRLSLRAVGTDGETELTDTNVGIHVRETLSQLEARRRPTESTEWRTPCTENAAANSDVEVTLMSPGAALWLCDLEPSGPDTAVAFAIGTTPATPPNIYRLRGLSEDRYRELVSFFQRFDEHCSANAE